MLLIIFIIGIVVLVSSPPNAYARESGSYEAKPLLPAFYTCYKTALGKLVGIAPYNGDPEDGVRCNYFEHCTWREDGSLNNNRFKCNDSEKPFYNAEACECVATDDHCGMNESFLYKCTRPLKDEEDVEEPCRSYGLLGEFLQGELPNLSDPTKFWHCSGWNNTATFALSKNCSDGVSDLIYDNSACRCVGRENETEVYEFNKHPMSENRFRCSEQYNPKSKDYICLDGETNNFYKGNFANPDADQSIFWTCKENGDSSVSAFQQSCSSNELFSIRHCCCTDEDFELSENFEPSNRFNCSVPIEGGYKESCADENGVYHLGSIPHKKDCTMYWDCGYDGQPQLRHCQNQQKFDVTSTFCGCNYGELVNCAANVDPANKFLCANQTVSSF